MTFHIYAAPAAAAGQKESVDLLLVYLLCGCGLPFYCDYILQQQERVRSKADAMTGLK